MQLTNILTSGLLTAALLTSCGGNGDKETSDRQITSDMIRQGAQQTQTTDETAEREVVKGEAKFSFNNRSLNLGAVDYGNEVSETFRFTNTGSEPLEIFEVSAELDAITAEYSREPIQPGEEGYIEIIFNSTLFQEGEFRQIINILANTETGKDRILVSGEIVDVPLTASDNPFSLQAGGGNTDQYGRPPGDPHYGHNHPPRQGEPGFARYQQQQQQQQTQQPDGEEGETDQYGRPPGHDHYGHDHPPLDQQQQQQQPQIEMQPQEQDHDGETDQYGRPPGHDHYGHDHPPLDQQQQQQQIEMQPQEQDHDGETDQYGRPPGHDHYGHDHPPLDQQQQQQQIEMQPQEQDQDGETDQYGRPPGHDHYGHDHPPLDQQQQQQQIEMQPQEQDQDGETDQYGRPPGHDHYGHDHPPLDENQEFEIQQQEQDNDQ